MKYGFLFGAGAEVGYGLPSGGKFALDIFRHDVANSKNMFKTMRENVDEDTNYGTYWLPDGFKGKNISSFGKSVFQNIIKDTIEHNKNVIIDRINKFDDVARQEVESMGKEGIDIDALLSKILGKDIDNIRMGQSIKYIEVLKKGNDLFNNSYFAALLKLYTNKNLFGFGERYELEKILLSITQLHVGALGESLAREINDGVFAQKDDDIDFLDDIGEILTLNYSSSGSTGMEYLLDNHKIDTSTEAGMCIQFARNILESIYAAVLDYKSLIDANWHYLYSPKSDWAKFCKICIFLLNVRDYISNMADNIQRETSVGYYHALKKAVDESKFEMSAIATTNYNQFITEILETDVAFLNGSTETWYDPYLNRIGSFEELTSPEKHILVPLMFTQSGTKPMTSIEMSIKYVDTYKHWKNSDKVIVVGFGFGVDDEHINGIIRTLIDKDNKEIIVVTLNKNCPDNIIAKEIARKIKTSKSSNISVIQVDSEGKVKDSDVMWTNML